MSDSRRGMHSSLASDRDSWNGTLALKTFEQLSAALCVVRSFDSFSPRIVYANTAFCRLTGYSAEELAGESLEILHGPATCQQAVLGLRRAIAASRPHRGELTQYRKDGSPFRVELQSDPIVADHGESCLWVTIHRELPEPKEQVRSIAGSWQGLYDTMRRNLVYQIAAGTIHEFLQPLYAIGNLAAACRNAIEAERGFDQQKVLGWLDVASSTVEDAKGLLLRLRKVGPPAVKVRTVGLDEVIQPVVRMLANELQQADVTMELDLACDATVEVDVSQLQQVLAELVFNASDALKKSRAWRYLKIRTWNEDGVCHVAVDDNGPGIATEVLGEVFKPFYSTGAERPGLGLSFCKSMISAHGGSIMATSNDNGGVCVHFTIPEAPSSSNVQ